MLAKACPQGCARYVVVEGEQREALLELSQICELLLVLDPQAFHRGFLFCLFKDSYPLVIDASEQIIQESQLFYRRKLVEQNGDAAFGYALIAFKPLLCLRNLY